MALELNYSVETSPFGDLLVVSSDKGICSVRFVDHSENIQEIVKRVSIFESSVKKSLSDLASTDCTVV